MPGSPETPVGGPPPAPELPPSIGQLRDSVEALRAKLEAMEARGEESAAISRKLEGKLGELTRALNRERESARPTAEEVEEGSPWLF